jgi:hypothetical protein
MAAIIELYRVIHVLVVNDHCGSSIGGDFRSAELIRLIMGVSAIAATLRMDINLTRSDRQETIVL